MWQRRWLLLLLAALSWASWGQEFTPIYENLDRLDSIMSALENSNAAMARDNGNLNAALETLSGLLKEQGALLREQEQASGEMRELSERQAALLGKYIARSKNLRIGLLIGIPAAAGLGLLAGWLASR
jgi:hypothetical protein